jgi:hypothetical protein
MLVSRISPVGTSWTAGCGRLRRCGSPRPSLATMPGTYTEVPIPFELTPGRDRNEARNAHRALCAPKSQLPARMTLRPGVNGGVTGPVAPGYAA